MGMVGGGRNAFIGAVHRMASRLDDRLDLVCGAFSSDPQRSLASGTDLGLPIDRIYDTWSHLFAREAELPADRRMEMVVIVTPNDLHAEIALAALDAGFHVLCDKPLAHSVKEAEAIADRVAETGLLFGVTYNYSGYPMVREARQRVLDGEIGPVRKVIVEYCQGWLAQRIEGDQNKQAIWRTDPARAGVGGALGDIGSHAAHLAEFVLSDTIDRVCADLGTTVSGRALDDDASVFLRFSRETRGLLVATQVAVGRENALRLRVFGECGSLEWFQEEPNSLILDRQDRPRVILRTGGPDLCDAAIESARLPAGHPEGFVGAFANLYSDFASAVLRRRNDPLAKTSWVPTVQDGLQGMRFIEAAVRSSQENQAWVELRSLED